MPEATRAGITKVHITDQDGVTLGGTGGGPATIADGADVAEGARADAAWDGIAASATVVAILKKIATSGASAGLTDAQLRATPVPVSGTFWQVTQPVSGTFWQATQPVSIAAAVAVTGTFWQATQPISAAALPLPAGASTEATLALLQVAGGTAIGALKNQLVGAVAATSAPSYTDGTINPLSQTLAGALRVGGTVTATGPLTDVQLRATPVPVSGTFWQATQPVSGTVTVTPPTLTKGTQGATGFSVQDLRDAGRNSRIFMLDAFVAAPLVEAMQSVVQWYGNAAVAGTVSPAVVPAGKTLRLTGWKIMYQSLATVGLAVVRVRINTAGTAVLGSPLAFSFEAGSGAGATTVAMTGGVTTESGSFPEGFDIPAAAGVGFSMAGYGPTGVLTLEGGTRFAVYGYEF